MRRLCRVCTLILLLVCSGCGASRHAIRSDTQTVREATASLQTETAVSVSGETVSATELAKDEEIVTEIVEFDTALPADPATGTHPVKRKTTQTKRVATRAQEIARAGTETAETFVTGTEVSEKEETAIRAEEETRKGLNWIQKLLCGAGLAAFFGIALWLTAKRCKR